MIQPLEGIRVLEWAAYHAGPAGAAILGDLGAEVIKIEQPGVGDPSREAWRVGRISLGGAHGRTVWNEAANRGKKSITVDLGKEEGREIAYRLAGESDVFLTNVRRGTVESMKMDYGVLSQFNPRLIYVWVSAYGPDGPDRNMGGFDYQAQARSGMMFSVGGNNMPPMVSQFAIIDQATAIMASQAVLTALFMRERSGIGQEVNVSVLGTSLYLLYMNMSLALISNFEVAGHQRTKEQPLRNYYLCADDRWLMMTVPTNRIKEQWPTLCEVIGHPELVNDPRFDSEESRFDNSEKLVAIFDQIFATKPRDEWLCALKEHDFFSCAVNRTSELVDDPQIMDNEYIVDFDHPAFGRVKIPGYPVQFGKSWAGTQSAAPELGEHTDEVLTEIGGYTRDEIAEFRGKGVI